MEYFARRHSNPSLYFQDLAWYVGGGGTSHLHSFVPEMVRTEDPGKISLW